MIHNAASAVVIKKHYRPSSIKPNDSAPRYKKITAIDETVAVVRERTPRSLLDAVIEDKDEVRILKKGNSIRCRVIVQNPISLKLSDFAPDTLIIVDDENITHRLKRSGVQITCVPREDPIIGKYFPDLSEIPYES